jgi:hypothetical protein
MKKVFLLSFILSSVIGFTQTTTKQQDIQELLSGLHVKSSVEKMAKQGIELYKKQKPIVPDQVWNDILASVDYNVFLNKISSILDSNYTQLEIKHLIDLAYNAKAGMTPKLKPNVKEQIYNASNDFGNKVADLINQELKNKGY